jgi:hypothetical protein
MGRPRWTNRLTVEQCPIFLCARSFQRGGMFTAPSGTVSTITWPGIEDLVPPSRINCAFSDCSPAGLRIFVPRQSARPGVPVAAQVIDLTVTRPHLGGKRYWFQCGCGRRTERLYLPLGLELFRCRYCYHLTYTSAQQHDQRVYDLAQDVPAMQADISCGERRRALLGVSAFILRLKWTRKRGFCFE